jgi:hypothetical protein
MGYAWAVALGFVLMNQLLTLAAQLAYACAFRKAYERQAAVLRARFWPSLGLGAAVCGLWLGIGYGAFFLAAAKGSASILVTLTVPLYLAIAAGGAVSLGALSSKVLRLKVEEHPYLCIAVGQVFAVAAALLPKAGPLAVSLYACSGIGAIALSEFSARPDDDDAPRLGSAGLISMVVVTVALALGLWRANSALKEEAASAGPAAAWTSASQR